MSTARGCGAFLLAATVVLALAAGERAHAAIAVTDVQIVVPGGGSVAKYAKVELLVTLTGGTFTQPYNPDPATGGIDLSASFSGPGGTWAVNGFYDGANWLIRFAPNAEGAWTFSVTARDASGTSTWTGGSFACTFSSYPGWPRIDGHYLRYSGGTTLFAVGHNTGWQGDVEQPPIADMAAKGENLLSFWLAMPWAQPSWGGSYATRGPIENAEQGIGNYNQAACAYLDGVVGRAEAAGVSLLPTIWSHGQLRDAGHPWGTGWWTNNAYSTVCSAANFFVMTSSGADTAQWRYQKNFYRYLIARWGYSRSIAGWVSLCEVDGTTGYVASQSQVAAWVAAVRDYFRANDPFHRNAGGTTPIVATKTDWSSGATSYDGGDLRACDSYTSQGSNVGVAYTIATQTRSMWSSNKPCLHTEFGGDTTQGATQPTFLHNGIWPGTATGAAVTPLLWCDGGGFPMLDAAMQNHLQYLAQFAAGIDYLGSASLAAASISISSPCRAWGMKLTDRGFAWVQNTTGTMGGQSLSISGVTAGSYRVLWYDAWTSGASPLKTSTVTVSGTGKLTVTIPTLARADIALKFTPNINNAPVANAQSVTTAEDTPAPITLTATDADGDPLTYAVVAQPAHGTLSGTAPNLTYTPAANYNGSDSFTFKANDGKADSNIATVATTVTPVNDPPVANAQSVTTPEDTVANITLTATDAEGDALTYTVLAPPAHGTLSGTAPNLTYTPDANYNGPDSFTFQANDGTADSNAATVTITVSSVNDPPVADSQAVGTPEDTPVGITLTATDADGDALSYAIVDPPAHGVLGGTAPNLTYTPAANYNGSDSFTFQASDGTAASNLATVAITIDPVNDPPIADDQSVATASDSAAAIALTATDTDGDPLTYAVVAGPSHGTLAGTAPDLVYTPESGYAGSDSFTFRANDGQADSNVATVTIDIGSVNHPPIADGQSVTTPEDTAANITLAATDPDSDPLTYAVVAPPEHGALSGVAPNLTYTPAANYSGPDSFTFQASDGRADSNVATVSITVTAVNDPPVAVNDTATTSQNTAVTLPVLANDTDADGDTLSVSAVTQGTNGTVTTDGTTATYVPNPGFYGSDSFTYTASDGHGGTATATVAVSVADSALPDIYGRITNQSGGAGIAGITVTLTRKSGSKWVAAGTTTTNAQGYYTFSRLALATYRVTPSSANYTFTPTYRQIGISRSSDHMQANFTAVAKTGTKAKELR